MNERAATQQARFFHLSLCRLFDAQTLIVSVHELCAGDQHLSACSLLSVLAPFIAAHDGHVSHRFRMLFLRFACFFSNYQKTTLEASFTKSTICLQAPTPSRPAALYAGSGGESPGSSSTSGDSGSESPIGSFSPSLDIDDMPLGRLLTGFGLFYCTQFIF